MGRTRTFAYQPALDGVRALAIVLVLLFHLGYRWMPGGYLGVSVFFTLSGFLITSLLLDERLRSGSIRARAFYARRIRRLLPGSLVCLAGISVLVALGAPAVAHTPRSDIVGALLQVTNWQKLLAHQSYADLFRAPSPVAHFWSLAIEEQFYWVWPFAMAGIAAWATRRRRPVAGVLVCSYVTFSIVAVATARLLGPDAVYYASWSRFTEILAGAALAAVIFRRTIPARAAVLAPVFLSAIVLLSVVTPSDHGWAYQGGLPLFALLSVGVIVGLQPASPLRAALSLGPIVWIGRVSYEVYLFHWPIFLVMTKESTGLDGLWLSMARLTVTFALAAIVFRAIEQPVRTKRVLARTRPLLATAAGGILIVLVAVALLIPASPPSHGPRPSVLAAAQLAPVATATPSGPAPAGPAPVGVSATTPLPPRPKTVAIFGDSVPDWLLRDAASTYVRTDFTVANGAHEACDGAVNLPVARDRRGKKLYPPSDCQEWPQSYAPIVEDPAHPVDVAILMIGQAPYMDRLVNDQWIGPCDSMNWYTDDVSARIAYLRQHVHQVVLALPSWSGSKVTYSVPDDHRARMACIRNALLNLATTAQVPAIDLASVLCPGGPDGDCAPYTSDDGVHVNANDAPLVLNWVLDSLPEPPSKRDVQ
jgi:peptidoglycan/LPS O-acetylase OafA/YrhL